MNTASSHSATARSPSSSSRLQLSCRAASPAAMRAAIDAGADWVHIPFVSIQPSMRCSKNDGIGQVVRYAHGRERKLALDLQARGPGLSWPDCRGAVAWAAAQGFDAIVTPDIALGLFGATQFPSLSLHFVAPAGMCARTARLLKVQMNVGRLVVPAAISVAELVEITSETDVDVEILASGTATGSFTAEPASVDAPCNDPCYSPAGHLTASLRQLPLMASLGVRAIQVTSRSKVSEDVASITRLWRTAIDRCFKDGKHCVQHTDWQSLLGLQRRR